jgi:hypothetical protein
MSGKIGLLSLLFAVFLVSGCDLLFPKYLFLTAPIAFRENDYSANQATVSLLTSAGKNLVIHISVDSNGMSNVIVPAYVIFYCHPEKYQHTDQHQYAGLYSLASDSLAHTPLINRIRSVNGDQIYPGEQSPPPVPA